MQNNKLDINDFVRMFGVKKSEFDNDLCELVDGMDLSYHLLEKHERDKVILYVINRLDKKEFTLAGQKGKERWDSGWYENLDKFKKSNYNIESLTPKYVRPNQPLRLYKDYVVSSNDYLELDYFTVLRKWLFKNYISPFQDIYEFGCGSGYNLAMLADLFKDKQIFGLDWSKPAVEIANLIGEKHYSNVSGHLFDMFNPKKEISFSKNSCVLTIGALEQLGKNHNLFVDHLLDKKPSICLHVEPIVDYYDTNNLIDYLASRFHYIRNYLDGFIPYLHALEKTGKIKIIKEKRVEFGSLFHDGWSLVFWQPI